MEKLYDSEFCKLVIEKGLASQAQVDECLEVVRQASALGASVDLVDTIVSKNIVARGDADAILATIRKQRKIVLGGYELLEKIGQGGMGIVYKAKQLSMNRLVAIKVVRRALSQDRVFVERFIREAHSAAKLNHTNIIHAIDAGQADGYHYFVMEYVEGVTVAERMRKQPFSEQEALKVARDMADALNHAQKSNIVHRDIKPENIMLSKDGTAKLADLGLAKTSDIDSSVTMVGKTIGTPHYMSPEQARGEEGIDTRSDIYSLGATLFHMLTNKLPFKGDTPAVVIAKRLNEPVPSAKTLKPEISVWTDRLVTRMMAKNSADRYQTAEELLGDIHKILRGEPLSNSTAVGTASRINNVSAASTGVVRAASTGAYPASRPAAGGRSQARQQGQAGVAEPANSNTILFIGGAAATVVIIVAALFLLKADPQQVANERAAAAYVNVMAFVESNPNQAGVERLASFISEHKGTDKAAEAAARMDSLKALLTREAASAELKALCDALVTEHKYGEAINSIDQFLQSNASVVNQDNVNTMRENIAARASEHSAEIVREAQAALEAGEFAESLKKLQTIAAFGFEPTTKIMNEQIAEVKRREGAANNAVIWQRIKRDTAALIEKEDFDAALKLLEQARNLPAADFRKDIESLYEAIAAGQEAVEAREIARAEAINLYTGLFEEEVKPLIAQRDYEKALEALNELAEREDIVLAAEAMAPARKDIQLLQSFWAQVEVSLSATPPGRMVSIDGQMLQFVKYEGGRITAKMGAAEVGRHIRRLRVSDITKLLGADFPKTEEQTLQYAVFLIYDGTAEPGAARAFLSKIPRTEEVARYIRLAGHGFEALEEAAEEAFAVIERQAARNPAGIQEALNGYKAEFGSTRTYNEKLFEMERMLEGDTTEGAGTLQVPGIDVDMREVVLGYWSMDSNRSNIMPDFSGRGNHANVTPQVRMRPGIKGAAVHTGQGQVIVPWRPAFNPRGSFSVDFCMQIESFPSGTLYSRASIIMVMGAVNRYYSYSREAGGFTLRLYNGRLYFDMYPYNYAVSTAAGSMVRMGEWYHIAAVVDSEGRMGSLYINGRRATSFQTSAVINNSAQNALNIGGIRGRRFNGLIDEVRFWSLPLNERQVVVLADHVGLGPGVSQAQLQRQRQEAIQAIRNKMNADVTIDYIDYPLPYAVVGILNQVGVSYQWEASAQAIGELMDETLSLEKEGTAVQLLAEMLRPFRLEYTVTDSGVLVHPEAGFLPPGAIEEERETTAEERLQDKVTISAPYQQYGDSTTINMIQVQYAVTDILEQVAVQFDLETSLRVAPAEMRRWITPNMREVRCTDALDLILQPLNLTYRVIDDRVVILRR